MDKIQRVTVTVHLINLVQMVYNGINNSQDVFNQDLVILMRQIWNPNDQKCVTKTKLDICPEGSIWNYKTNTCVPNYSASLAGLY